jgi:hypothetical protein
MENFGRIDAPDGATLMWCRPHPLVLPEPKKFTHLARNAHAYLAIVASVPQKSLNRLGAEAV